MPKLCERSRVKDLINVARADTIYDRLLDGLIDQAGEQVEGMTGRQFTKLERVEYHQSYEQSPYDPMPQYIWLEAFPIDLAETFSIVWAPANDHDVNGVALTNTAGQAPSYVIPNNGENTNSGAGGLVIVRGPLPAASLVLLPNLGQTFLGYAPQGFRVTYTGGYDFIDDTPSIPPDPMDDIEALAVPIALRQIVAQKIADDFLFSIRTERPKQTLYYPPGPRQSIMNTPTGLLLPWTPEQQQLLRPFRSKATI